MRAILALALLALASASAALAEDPALDQKVRRFLETNRGAWRDTNVPWVDGQILHDLVALGATIDTFGGSNKIIAKIAIPEKTDINRQLAHIEELKDLGWLFE